MIITCFGHSSFNEFAKFEDVVMSWLYENTKGHKVQFYLGGYGSFDDFFHRCCLRFKKNNPNTSIAFITPYITDAYQRTRLNCLNSVYDEIIYPALEGVPYKFAIPYRNRWMVERADYIITYVNHKWGGAYQAYKYAIKKGKSVLNLGSIN